MQWRQCRVSSVVVSRGKGDQGFTASHSVFHVVLCSTNTASCAATAHALPHDGCMTGHRCRRLAVEVDAECRITYVLPLTGSLIRVEIEQLLQVTIFAWCSEAAVRPGPNGDAVALRTFVPQPDSFPQSSSVEKKPRTDARRLGHVTGLNSVQSE